MSQKSASSRATQAAARVAARYAKAPSFSEMQAAEARGQVPAPEIASADLPSQIAPGSEPEALAAQASLEVAFFDLPQGDPGVSRGLVMDTDPPAVLASTSGRLEFAEPLSQEDFDVQPFEMRREPENPVGRAEQANPVEKPEVQMRNASMEKWWQQEPFRGYTLPGETPEAVEPHQPIHANLIEFPRELVATRKVRPRLAEGANTSASDPGAQLSIFEVDPGSVSTDAAIGGALTGPATFEWSDIKLEAQSHEDVLLDEEQAPAAPALQLAPFSRRLLAFVVDCTLITAAFLAAAMVAASRIDQLPALNLLETGSVAALLLAGLLYQVFFFTLASATPGMKYAGISLCTFDDECPTRAQRCGRLAAMLLSVLPLGLGVVWALFDEDHMSWHDRLSRTYQRKC